ncbi:MAG: dihydrofolate reductase [Halobacteriota archaeon]
MMDLAIIAAVAANGVIGADGGMPWHYPEDLEHFKRTTIGHPVIMGRRTYESIAGQLGGPLPNRTNIVLSTTEPNVPDDVVVASSVDEALTAAEDAGNDVAFVVGGAAVYEQFLPLADRLVLTEIGAPYEGDTCFPEWDRDRWVEVARDDHGDFAFVEYERDEGSTAG